LIASVEGKLAEKREDSAVVEVAGLGLQLFLSSQTLAGLPAVGSKVKLQSHLYVREDLLQLYGFADAREREVFLQLITVSGVGPRMALVILSAFKPDDLVRVVAAEDLDSLTSIPGVGKKSGQRLLMELKDRLGPFPEGVSGAAGPVSADVLRDAREALRGLGYSASEIARALDGYKGEGDPAVEDLLRHALARIGGE
jgi:Holliday junction DNA helicase RuvA